MLGSKQVDGNLWEHTVKQEMSGAQTLVEDCLPHLLGVAQTLTA
jgi:hypothetical protein